MLRKVGVFTLVLFGFFSSLVAEALDKDTLEHVQTAEEQKLQNSIKPFIVNDSLYEEYFGRASFVQELLAFQSKELIKDVPGANINLNATTSDNQSFKTNLQMNVKEKLDDSFLGSGLNLYVAYATQTSLQFLRANPNHPVSVLTHNPQIYFNLPLNAYYGDFSLKRFYFGYSYQVTNNFYNQTQENTNQLFMQTTLGYGDIGDMFFKAWYYMPTHPNSSLVEKVDYGQFMLGWEKNRHSFGVTWYNQLKNDPTKGAFSLDYSLPLSSNFQLYFQYLGQYSRKLRDLYDVNLENQFWGRLVLVK